ncbi:DUF2523 domain-containing protein [Acinetobacter baumannii]|nr:DUF2523 domain-containing protein [Acinetobacter baumannii]
MPSILIRIFTWMMTSFAGQFLFSMGLGVLSFGTLKTLLDYIVERIKSGFGAASHDVLIFVDLLALDYYISVLISALIIKVTIMSAQVALTKRGA